MDISKRIMDLRKKQGWSQEELAGQLGVSRQSVSKWESGSSIPDINRILQMSELFGVTTDHLLKDENSDGIAQTTICEHVESRKEKESAAAAEEPDRVPRFHRALTTDEINAFMEATSESGRRIALGVSLCILSPAVLIGLAGTADEGGFQVITEDKAVLIGMICLFLLIAYAVTLFVRGGTLMNRYHYIKAGDFDMDEGSKQVIESVLDDFEPQFSSSIAKGVALCIMSPVPLIAIALIGFGDQWAVMMVPVLLIMVSVGVNIFVRMGIMRDGLLQLLKRKEYDPVNQENAKREERIGSIYWPVVVAVYLLWSYTAEAWRISWMIFPVAGLVFAAISNAMKK